MLDLTDVITGAIIEIQFELRHYSIKQSKIDSFNATIQQIRVLKSGKPRPPTAFKRKDMGDEPIEVGALRSNASPEPYPPHQRIRLQLHRKLTNHSSSPS